MHLKNITLNPDRYPTRETYPFTLKMLYETKNIVFTSPVTFFVGENGTGKSTLLKAICQKCGIHIWEYRERRRYETNPYEDKLHRAIDLAWADGKVHGSFFSSELFENFSQSLDEWAVASPEIFNYYGGKSLITQSHGQSIMSFFKARYQIKGIYFMDEPETALSPKSQIELLTLLNEMSRDGHAQFIIATHSPIIMACPGACIYSFDKGIVEQIEYEKTEQYRVYKSFLEDRTRYLGKA